MFSTTDQSVHVLFCLTNRAKSKKIHFAFMCSKEDQIQWCMDDCAVNRFIDN